MDIQKMQEVNVRVAVRVRPLLPKEKLSGEQICVKILPKTNQLVLGKDRAFTFDYVLSSKHSQQQVYDRCMEQLVTACFEGYNATVFAYGQTGSGKTFTVGGGNIASQTEEDFGIIPRAIVHMYDHMKSKKNVEFTVKVSYIEIYCEDLKDLLDPETSSKDLHIREDDKANTVIMGASEVECGSMEDVMTCLEQGSASRHTGSTQMNEHSSRSHSVFTMLIEQRWCDLEGTSSEKMIRSRLKSDDSEIILDEAADMEHYMCSKFHFVDLAGSERAHRTGNIGDRFKESVHINSGLLALGNVISALGDVRKKGAHIPYRDSKITRLLKDSLGGNAKTVMICCISPSSANLDESLNALKYANRARNITNKPIVNRDPQSIRFEEMQTEIKALREELQRQRTSVMTNDVEMQRTVIQEASHTKGLEDKIIKLQTESGHYRMVAEEAYKQLLDIHRRDVLSQSQDSRLKEWLELMEELQNKVPTTLNKDAWENQTIKRLENELHQCKDDLKSDEEIFAEKAKEMNHMQEAILKGRSENEELLARCEHQQEVIKDQSEQLVEKEMLLQDLAAKIKELQSQPVIELDSSVASSGPPTSNRRAKSVPVNMLERNTLKTMDTARNIHTSPALFSLERVMQGFRARSQLLVCRIDDSDDVMQPQFDSDGKDDLSSDESDDDDDVVVPVSAKKVQGKTGRPFSRTNVNRGTYKVQRPQMPHASLNMEKSKSGGKNRSTAKETKSEAVTEQQKKQLKQTELDVRQSTQKMRDLSINIKLKEALIKQLVKNGHEAEQMNRQYEGRISNLEDEKREVKQELTKIQKAMQDLEMSKQQSQSEKARLQIEFQKKLELAKTRYHALQRKQKDTEKMASITGNADKRIQDLELAISRMRDQQEQLQKRLKDETDRKGKLQREMSKEQQKIKELEIRTEQQKKVLRIKTDEMNAMTKKLRTTSQVSTPVSKSKFALKKAAMNEEQAKLDEQKKWMDQELESILEQRRQSEEILKELEKREDIVAKKEAMLAERSELEFKKLRSSQILNKDVVMLGNKLEVVDTKINEKVKEIANTPRNGESQAHLKEELTRLKGGRERLAKQQDILKSKLLCGSHLSPQEERRLIEIEESLDALEAAIEYKNESIRNRKEDLRTSTLYSSSEDNLLTRLRSLNASESRSLLSKYFDKVVDLREELGTKEKNVSELEVRIEEQEKLIQEMESSLQRAVIEKDRKLTAQQQEYERKMQILMKQLSEMGIEKETPRPGATDSKTQQLEKDLYYYKKTSRELKKKLRELMSGVMSEKLNAQENGGDMVSPRQKENRTPRLGTPRDDAEPQEEGAWDRLHVRRGDGAAPSGQPHVRISRKELRRMSEEEVVMRKSLADLKDTTALQDSLDVDGDANL